MRLYFAYIHSVFVPLARSPGYVIPVILFPTLLYSFFGVQPSQRSPQTASILLASWSAFAVIGIGFFQFGVGIAQSREEKWTAFVRTLPTGASPMIVAQLVTAAIFIVMSITLLWGLAYLTTPINLSIMRHVLLFLALITGVVPFVMMGVTIGFSLPARVAVPIGQLIYLPLSYLGGLWFPPNELPGIVARVSPFMPTRQLGELVWAAVLDGDIPWSSVKGLAAYAIVFAIISAVMWRRDEAAQST